MTDRLFRSMVRDRDSRTYTLEDYANSYECQSCGTRVYPGMWPWCGGRGKEGHER